MTPRALLSLLFHAEKALDLVQTAHDERILERLDRGPVSLGELAKSTGAAPLRLYKLLDGLESLGFVDRRQPDDAIESATYVARRPLADAARAVLGASSIERDRDRYPWREIVGRLPEVLRGDRSARFAWPPRTDAEIAGFEASMAAGCPPIIEAFRTHRAALFGAHRPARWLDVGGGDGVLAAEILAVAPELTATVYNLPRVEPLVRARAAERELSARLDFVGGDFLEEPLPAGFDVLSFVRVLHDWPAETARMLLSKAYDALAPGGIVVICEELRSAERLAIQFFWTYFLIWVDACVSRLREVEWYERVVVETGFEPATLLPGPFDILYARKPAR